MTLPSSPAPSSDQVPDEDRVSQSSNDSRRQSEAVQIDGIPQGKDHKHSFLLTFLFVSKIYFCSDTWSTLTEVLGNYTFRAKTPGLSQAAIKPNAQLISPSSLKLFTQELPLRLKRI